MSVSELNSPEAQRVFRLPLLLVLFESSGIAQGLFAHARTGVNPTDGDSEAVVETVATVDPQVAGSGMESSDLMSCFSGSTDLPGEVTANDVATLRPPVSMQAEGGGH